jgi:hypothetical protein
VTAHPPLSSPLSSALLAAFDFHIAWCLKPAPFTARVLALTRHWLLRDDAARRVLEAIDSRPLHAAVPLRWAGALHLLALRGLAPWALLWPPAGRTPAFGEPADAVLDAALEAAIEEAWRTQQPLLRDALSRPPQTNEVQRSAVLLPGLLHVAGATGLPLVLLEIGSSAGLNLWCERYAYAYAGPGGAAADGATVAPVWRWDDGRSPLTMRAEWLGPAPWPQGPPPLQVLRRAGCDQDPIDLRQPAQARRLASFIWPDQPERLARLVAARGAAAAWLAQDGVAVEALPAAAFVERELRQRQPGAATVLMHSVVWQYIEPAQQRAIEAALQDAGARATAGAPLAWLRLEPPSLEGHSELRCRLWPGGTDRLLARCHPHGARIEWLAGAAA